MPAIAINGVLVLTSKATHDQLLAVDVGQSLNLSRHGCYTNAKKRDRPR